MRSSNRASIGLPGWLILLALVVCAGLALSIRGWQWGVVKRSVKAKHPSVQTMSVDDVAEWLKTPEHPQPVIVDVRTKEEFDVSRIEGARRVEPGATAESSGLGGLARNQPILLYCSVGFRSAELAQKLMEAGFTNVWNLEGSLFQWVNTGHRVVSASGETTLVHPYNKAWGRFLERERRAPLPKKGGRAARTQEVKEERNAGKAE